MCTAHVLMTFCHLVNRSFVLQSERRASYYNFCFVFVFLYFIFYITPIRRGIYSTLDKMSYIKKALI